MVSDSGAAGAHTPKLTGAARTRAHILGEQRTHRSWWLKKRRTAAVAGLSALALAAAGCTTGGSGADGGDGDYSTDTLRMALVADPSSFLPLQYAGVSATITGNLLYANLVYRDEDQAMIPGLASEFDVVPERGEFTIREDATCADGTPITPSVVAGSLEAFIDNSRSKEVVFGPGEVTVTPDDAAGTVTIDLEEPWSDMEQSLALSETGIMCPAALEDPEAAAAGEVEAGFSGAYTLAGHQAGVSVTLEKREDGFTFPEFAVPIEGVPPETVSFQIMSDYNAVANGLLTDTVDYALMNGEPMERVTENEGFHATRYAGASMFIMFNERDGMPMADVETRRAVAQAVSREAFNDAANKGAGELLNSYVPDSVACAYEGEDDLIQQDVDAAADVLEGMSISFLGAQAVGPNGAGNTYVAQALEEAGADVSLRTVDDTTWATELDSMPDSWDITVYPLMNLSRTQYGGLGQFIGSTPDAGGRNSSGETREGVVAQVREASAEADEDTRCEIYQEVQGELLRDAVVVPLATLPTQPTTREGFAVRQIGGAAPTITISITE